ncbi:MAG: CARDB domain-containing protein [Schlesneria sp.]
MRKSLSVRPLASRLAMVETIWRRTLVTDSSRSARRRSSQLPPLEALEVRCCLSPVATVGVSGDAITTYTTQYLDGSIDRGDVSGSSYYPRLDTLMSYLATKPAGTTIEMESLYNPSAKVTLKNASGVAQIEVPFEFVQNSPTSPLVFFEAPQTPINFKVNFGAAQATGSNKKDVYFYQDGSPIGQKMNSEDYGSNGYILQTSVANGTNPPIKSAGDGSSKHVSAVITKDQASDQLRFHPVIYFYNYPNLTYKSASLSAQNGTYADDGTMQVQAGTIVFLTGNVYNMGTASTGVASKFSANLISPGNSSSQTQVSSINVLGAGASQSFTTQFSTTGLAPGRYTVNFNIDSTNVVHERDEIQNTSDQFDFDRLSLDPNSPLYPQRTYASNNSPLHDDVKHLYDHRTSFTFEVKPPDPIPPSVTSQPANVTMLAGGTASFTAAASSTPTPNVQWQVYKTNDTHWTDIPGATSTTYSFIATSSDNGNQYRAAFTNAGGSTSSNAATLTVVLANVTKTSVQWGSSGTADLVDASGGRLLPVGRTNDIDWFNIRSVSITLDQPIPSLNSSDVSINGVVGGNYSLGSISGAGNYWTITLGNAIASADNVTVTIGNGQLSAYTRRLDILPGDFNDDGVVSSTDMTLLNNASAGSYTLLGDLNGDGVVDINDGKLARARIGSKRIV